MVAVDLSVRDPEAPLALKMAALPPFFRNNADVFARMLQPTSESCPLLGSRGTGKSTWVGQRFPDALVLDPLDYAIYTELLPRPDAWRRSPLPHPTELSSSMKCSAYRAAERGAG